MSTSQNILARLAARDSFSLAEVRRWIADESSLELWYAVHKLLGPGWTLIRPEPDMEEACAFICRHLLRCIHENPQDRTRNLPTGYEAAHDLSNTLKHWAAKLPQTHPVLIDAEKMIAAAYLTADPEERDRLLNGFLEHALESEPVRPFFHHWSNHPTLAEPWRLAMEWADHHT